MLLLAFLGGVLTIASPCILPVIPLVFARAGRSAMKETVPLLLGLALAFTAAALIATTTTRWLLAANEVARVVALVLLAAVGVALVSPVFAAWLTFPVSYAASRLLGSVNAGPATVARNVIIGAAVGILWAPCAGPILGLLIAAASTSGDARAASLFLTFALGAATMLGLLLAFGGRALTFIRRLGTADYMIRRTLGVATLATVVALAFGWDQALFSRGGIVNTAQAENLLIRRLAPDKQAQPITTESAEEFLRTRNPGGHPKSPTCGHPKLLHSG